jgi:hypothetical protein
MARSSIVSTLFVLLLPGVLANCSSAGGVASSDDEGTADTQASALSSDPSPVKRVERLPSGLLKVTKGNAVQYLRANCPRTDGTKTRCFSYSETDAEGRQLTANAPGLSCSGGTGVCLGATDLATAYAIPTSTASDATIAIIGWADNPNFESDMATYRSTYGLPACTSASGCFKKVNQSGATSPLAAASGPWVGEESLDLTMASAGCPTCKILLVEATSDLYTAIAEAVALGASVVSYSGGQGEFSGQTADDAKFAALGAGLFASTGDNGGSDTTGDISWPAVSTAFTGVGGTDLSPSSATFPDGTPRGWTETAWVQPNTQWGGAGWGCSQYEPKPWWQADTGCSKRTVGDVAAIAGTGVWIYSTPPGGMGNWSVQFGTSVASPLVAAIYAQTGASHAGPIFSYRGGGVSGFTDITTNIAGPGTCPSTYPAYFCNAQVGYDSPTGNGSPNGARIAAQSNWNSLGTTVPSNAIVGGIDSDGSPLYVCRAPFESSLQPGKTRNGWGTCDVGWGGGEHWVGGAEILVSAWASATNGALPPGASFDGYDGSGHAVYSCRATYQGGLHPGHMVSTGCSIPWGGAEHVITSYQVPTNGFGVSGVTGAFPSQALLGGYESDGTPLYLCLASYGGLTVPGKMHSTWTSCDISSGGSEVFATTYQVLVPYFAASTSFPYAAGVDGNGATLGACRVAYSGTTQVGKYLSYGACNFGFGGLEVSLTSGYQVLVTN